MRSSIITLVLAAFFSGSFYQGKIKPLPRIAPQPCYDSVKLHITQLQARLKNAVAYNDTNMLQKYFVRAVADSVIPYWYGTTQLPGKGAIACGYFVSTVLRDAGLRLNRVKMGQSSSEALTYALAEKKDIKLFYDKPLPGVIAYLKSKGAGLYIIGLDCHVGFILVDNGGVWFIHSKWFAEKAVVKEDAATSNILYYSKYRMVGKISNSRKLLKAWLLNEPVSPAGAR